MIAALIDESVFFPAAAITPFVSLLCCDSGDKCHRAGLQAASSHGLSGCAAPTDAGLLAERQERSAKVPRYCQHVGQDDTQPCFSQGRHKQHCPVVSGDTNSFTHTNKLSSHLTPPCPYSLFSSMCSVQSSPSSLVRPWSSRPEQGELSGRLAGCTEDDPV